MQHLATKEDIAKVREDIERISKNSLKWVVGIMITSLIASVAATATVMGVIVQ